MSTTLIVAPSKADVPAALTSAIVPIAQKSLEERNAFTIALSGGSLPAFLSVLPDAFTEAQVEPCWDKWHVLLADERCVPITDGDSNLGSIQAKFLSKVGIPESQIYGIDEALLDGSTEAIAEDYEGKLKTALGNSGGMLDLAVLGFGPDGHTCSLFVGHALLKEDTKWVAAIEDSPKPPPKRITLTYPVLNDKTRSTIVCGAGSSKQPIIKAVFEGYEAGTEENTYKATFVKPAPYPCSAVSTASLTWIVDQDAVEGIDLA